MSARCLWAIAALAPAFGSCRAELVAATGVLRYQTYSESGSAFDASQMRAAPHYWLSAPDTAATFPNVRRVHPE